MKGPFVLRVQLLDGFTVELSDGRKTCHFERPSAGRLLQLLLLRPGRRAGREELADALFPRLSGTRAANALSKALTMARAALEPAGADVLDADRSTIWIRGGVPIAVDLDEHVAALTAALAEPDPGRRDELLGAALAERGRLLDGELYADWAIEARDELERLRAQARLTLARARSAGRGITGVSGFIDAWADVAAHDRVSEEACIELMKACAAAGQRDLTVRAYHRYRAAIEELGLEPAEAVETTYASALATGRKVPPTQVSTSLPLVFGRQRELERLYGCLGRGASVLVSGSAGIGKTHLLRVVSHRFERLGWLVLRGAAVPDDRRAPYASLRSALVPLQDSVPADGSPLALLARRSFVRADVQSAFALGGAEEGAHLADQVAELLDRSSKRAPVLLVIDDAQWADDALQSLLVRLVAREHGERWAAALAVRSDEPDAPGPALPSTVERIDLRPLADRDVGALVKAGLGRRLRPAALAQVVERSAGNPFFALELARQEDAREVAGPARQRIPVAIAALLRARVARCSPGARRMVPLTALAGAEASYELLLAVGAERALAGSPEHAVRALDELINAHLLVEAAGGVRPAHPLLREAALAEVNALRRAALHARIADGLEAIGGDAEAAARHRLAAFEAGRLREQAGAAARAGFAAGRHARDLLAYDAALELLEGGLEAFEATPAGERGDLRNGAVSAWLGVGDILCRREQESEGRSAYEAALALAATDEELARVWKSKAQIPYRRGDMTGAMRELRKGLSSLSGDSPLPCALLSCDLGWALHRTGRFEEAVVLLSEAYKVLMREGEPADAAYCADLVAITLSALNRREEALSVSDEAFKLAELGGGLRMRAMLHVHRAQILRGLGRLQEANDQAQKAATVFARPLDRYKRSVIHWITAEIRDDLGDIEGALAERDAEAALLREVGNHLNLARAEAHRAQLLDQLSRTREAREATEAAREAAARVGDPEWAARVEHWLAGGKISGRVES